MIFTLFVSLTVVVIVVANMSLFFSYFGFVLFIRIACDLLRTLFDCESVCFLADVVY